MLLAASFMLFVMKTLIFSSSLTITRATTRRSRSG